MNQELVELARQKISSQELRDLADRELADQTFQSTDLRLILAADLLCDTALDVACQQNGEKSISKTVVLDDNTHIPLNDFSIFKDLTRAFDESVIGQDDLEALMLRGSVANSIAQALDSGMSPQDIADSSIDIFPVRFSGVLNTQKRPKSLLARIFGKG